MAWAWNKKKIEANDFMPTLDFSPPPPLHPLLHGYYRQSIYLPHREKKDYEGRKRGGLRELEDKLYNCQC
jgi:hypothetical protein